MLNPGDPAAIAQGCKCPGEPNQDGQGTYGGTHADPAKTHFLVTEDCPMHGKTTWREES